MGTFNPNEYIEVADRIPLFWEQYPDGAIVTEILRIDGPEVIVLATLYRSAGANEEVLATGMAREVEGKSPVNRTSHVENAETSAIGRALANAGFTGSVKRASRQEMDKVARMREEHDALLDFIRTVGPKAKDDATLVVGGQTFGLKDYVRKNWSTIKEQFRVARSVVEAIEVATETPFAAEVDA